MRSWVAVKGLLTEERPDTATRYSSAKPGMSDVFEGCQHADPGHVVRCSAPALGSGVKVVVADLHEPFRNAFDECVPAAVQVADPMHVVMAANRCPDKTRLGSERNCTKQWAIDSGAS